MNFRTIFEFYVAVLEDHKKELRDKVKLDLTSIKGVRKTIKEDKTTQRVEYVPNRVRISIPKKLKPNHTIPRTLSSEITITLSLDKKIIFSTNKEVIDDPFIELTALNMILESGDFTSSWHLDRHTDEGIPKSFHPFYHLNFGGQYMEDLEEDGEVVFGRSLIFRTPRISHPPLDLILGIDFVLTHFFSRKELRILSDPSYEKVISILKDFFWKPYALCMAKQYCSNLSIDGKDLEFNETFVKKINGIYEEN